MTDFFTFFLSELPTQPYSWQPVRVLSYDADRSQFEVEFLTPAGTNLGITGAAQFLTHSDILNEGRPQSAAEQKFKATRAGVVSNAERITPPLCARSHHLPLVHELSFYTSPHYYATHAHTHTHTRSLAPFSLSLSLSLGLSHTR